MRTAQRTSSYCCCDNGCGDLCATFSGALATFGTVRLVENVNPLLRCRSWSASTSACASHTISFTFDGTDYELAISSCDAPTGSLTSTTPFVWEGGGSNCAVCGGAWTVVITKYLEGPCDGSGGGDGSGYPASCPGESFCLDTGSGTVTLTDLVSGQTFGDGVDEASSEWLLDLAEGETPSLILDDGSVSVYAPDLFTCEGGTFTRISGSGPTSVTLTSGACP